MPKGAEPAHKPKPPEHVKPVEPAKHGELRTLSGELTLRAKFIFDSVRSPYVEAKGPDRRRLVDKATEYRVGLHGYWTFIRDHASDVFVYRYEGSKPELDKLNDSLKKVDKDLAKQLERWAEVSSPYAESYDVTGIKETGKELSDIILAAGMQLRDQMEWFKRSPEIDRRNAFRAEMALGLSGMAEQIGSQMESLGKGETIPNVTIANETAELMNRAGQDDLKFKLKTKFDATSAARDALETFTPKFVESKLGEHYSIDKRIAMLEEKDPHYAEKFEQLQVLLENAGLLPFFEALAEPGSRELIAARDRLTQIKDALELTLDPDRRAAYLAERKTLLETMLPELRTLMEAKVQQNTERLERYETDLRDSTDNFDDKPYEFWHDTKERVLSRIEVLAGEETRRKLDEAFSSDLSDKVKEWRDILTKDTKPDPAAMQSRASDVVTTADTYLDRIEGVLKDADLIDAPADLIATEYALRELKGQLVSALTAIKLSTAEKLTDQFKRGRFKN